MEGSPVKLWERHSCRSARQEPDAVIPTSRRRCAPSRPRQARRRTVNSPPRPSAMLACFAGDSCFAHEPSWPVRHPRARQSAVRARWRASLLPRPVCLARRQQPRCHRDPHPLHRLFGNNVHASEFRGDLFWNAPKVRLPLVAFGCRFGSARPSNRRWWPDGRVAGRLRGVVLIAAGGSRPRRRGHATRKFGRPEMNPCRRKRFRHARGGRLPTSVTHHRQARAAIPQRRSAAPGH